jgi:microcystin degradation protein MlrC
MGPAILVVADRNARLAIETAKSLAQALWEVRDRCQFTGMPLSQAVAEAAKASATPVTLLDVGDNVGGGSPGDSTTILEALRRADVRNTLVVFYDPGAVRACASAGVGKAISLEIGGKEPQRNPVLVRGRVRLLHDGHFAELQPRHGGKTCYEQGLTAVVESTEGETIVFTSLRMAPFSLEQILSLGIKPEAKRVLVAKGAIAPRAAYAPVSARLLEVDTPGITAANPAGFHYRYRRRPMYPFEREATYSPAAEP